MPLTLLPVTAAQLAQDADFWALYAQAFPLAEREPPGVILRSLRQGVGVALAGRDGAAPTQALVTLHLLQDPDVVFLVYLALAHGRRGRGEGRAVLEAAWSAGVQALASRGRAARGLVWEVDPPETAPDAAERAVRERRLRFFERAGGVQLSGPYLQPPVGSDPAPLPMRLMYRAAPGQPALPAVPALVRAMYAQKYGAVNGLPEARLQALLVQP